jgi:isopenicillin-N N-acyltransferase-like protein
MTLPLIHLQGTPFEQGVIHGRKAREEIRHNLNIYFDRFTSEGKIPTEEVLSRATQYWSAIQRQNGKYAESLRGVAEGSGSDLIRLVALNVRYEIMYHQFTANSLADGCTAVAVSSNRTANGHLMIGENWDWIPHVQCLVLHIDEPETELLCFTEAGIVGGKIGLNSHGLGLAINGLNSTGDDWTRLKKPFHMRCYEILRSATLQDAAKIITKQERSCSANYLIAQVDDQMLDIETAPKSTLTLNPDRGVLTHSNHFVDAEALQIEEPPNEHRPYSCDRLDRLNELIQATDSVTFDDIQMALCDHKGHPYAICRHVDETQPVAEHYMTVVSVIMDLHDRVMWVSEGPPCEHEFQKLSL